MELTSEDLGPPDVWQIREFPRGLRQYIADEARKEGIKVGEWLTRVIVAYRGGDLGKMVVPRLQTASTNGPDELSELERLARLARLLTDEGKRSRPMDEARRLIWSRLNEIRLRHQPEAEAPSAASTE